MAVQRSGGGATAESSTGPQSAEARDAGAACTSSWPPVLVGLPGLMRIAFRGEDLTPCIQTLLSRLSRDSGDAGALMDLATIHLLQGQRDLGLACQAQALALEQVYRQPPARPGSNGLHLLMFARPGDFMVNTPIGLLLEDSDVTVDTVFVSPGMPPCTRLPEHDVAIVGISESDQSRSVLATLGPMVDQWPRPVVNHPTDILKLSRDTLWSILHDVPGISIPPTVRLNRDTATRLARGEVALGGLLPEGRFPVIIRPVGSHAGGGLEKIETQSALEAYLEQQSATWLYLSSFVDYRNRDGQFRKYRIAVIDNRPYVCHVATSSHWMVHYLSAGVEDSAAKKADEQEVFATFDETFALRHRRALNGLCDRIGLRYFVLDCAETADGALLVFEAGNAMIVHALDDPAVYPYKGPQMRKVFAAFRAMLGSASLHLKTQEPVSRG